MADAEAYVVPTEALPAWVEGLLRRAEVVAPAVLHGGDVAYDVVDRPEQVAWDYGSSCTPLKRYLYPQTDPLLRWEQSPDGGLQVGPIYDKTERVFLAIRPCDVAGVLFLDRVFSRDLPDPYYLERRRRSALIALACTQPEEHCFCVCADAGPFLDKGYDLQLTPLAARYLVEVGSDKGRELLQVTRDLFAPAPPEALARRQELERETEQRFGEHTSYFAAAIRKVTFDRVPEALWADMSDRCLDCGGCAFVCPTCTCFTVVDAGSRREGVRERLWDCCLYRSFTLEASGHNPREERTDRLKARFFHKLGYQFIRELGGHGCVGCGRCVVACLGSDHMPRVTASIRRGAMG